MYRDEVVVVWPFSLRRKSSTFGTTIAANPTTRRPDEIVGLQTPAIACVSGHYDTFAVAAAGHMILASTGIESLP
jgi:hypothetical protein